jgi:hypothetical protein
MTVTIVPVSLNQVAGPGAGGTANQGALLSADQCSSKYSCRGPDQCSLGSTVVWTTVEVS